MLLPPEVRTLAGRQCGALTAAQLRGLLSERALKNALRIGCLVRLWQGSYALPDRSSASQQVIPQQAVLQQIPNQQAVRGGSLPVVDAQATARIPVHTRLMAAELTLGRSVTACLNSAAEIYGFAVAQDGRTHIIGESRSTLGTLAVHRTPPAGPVRPVGQFAAVDAAETAIRLAGQAADAPRALAVLDAALRALATTQPALAAMSARLHVDRIGIVRDLVPLADPRAESPAESWLRWVCHDAGLPAPVPQCWVECVDGQWFRLDLGWPRYKLGLEYDGVQFHTGAALAKDRARLNALIRTGWTIVHCTAPLIFDGRPKLVEQLQHELQVRATAAS